MLRLVTLSDLQDDDGERVATDWVAPGRGSTVGEILRIAYGRQLDDNRRTNLLIRRKPTTSYAWERVRFLLRELGVKPRTHPKL